MNNFKLTYKCYFELCIPIENYLFFEAELSRLQLPFHSNTNEHSFMGCHASFLVRDEDRLIVDKIIRDNEIIASTPAIDIRNYKQHQKTIVLYIVMILALISITLIAGIIEQILS